MKLVGAMTYAKQGAEALDYLPCRYGRSKLQFRGPVRPVPRDYVCFIGGSETFGRFVARPYPALVEDMTGMPCLNLGSANAGLDSFLQDATVISLARGARMVVLQLMGPQYLSNRFYTVHPRRNDRFIKANAPLRRLYPSVDFTEFSFVGHLLNRLQHVSRHKFRQVQAELQATWAERMRLALRLYGRPVLLLWMEEGQAMTRLLDRDMLARLERDGVELLRIGSDQWVSQQGVRDMVFGAAQARAATVSPSSAYHRLVAQRLTPFVLNGLA